MNEKLLNVQKLCRACLSENKEMGSMLIQNEKDEVRILEMFIAIVCIEVKTSHTTSTNICELCEMKLRLCYNFQQECRKSNEILEKRAKQNAYVLKTEEIQQLNKDDDSCDLDLVKNVQEIQKEVDFESTSPIDKIELELDDIGDFSLIEPGCDETAIEIVQEDDLELEETKPSMINQKLRLKQYPLQEVQAAIEVLRSNFYTNVQCIKCGFIGSHSRALSVHMSHLHKELKERWCIECNEVVDNYAEHEESHKLTHLKCQFCKKGFNSRGHLLEHLRAHSVVRPFSCDVCNKSFVSQRHLTIHYRIHTNESPYQCKICFSTFKQQALLKNHHNKQHTNISFSDIQDKSKLCVAQNFCGVCNKNVLSLSLHNQQAHSENVSNCDDKELKKELCTVCGKQFNNKTKYKIHMRIHTGETPYKCRFCDKRINTRNQLVVHERTHTGEKPHICHFCGKSFAQSSVLNTHLMIHTGRPEICQICGQRFCRPAALRLHMRKHTGEKPFLCTECGQAFIQRSHLVEHSKIHSDVRSYQCTYCDKAFKQSSSLKSHIYIHLGNKPFKCSQCSYSCRQSYSLTQHMKGHTFDAPRLDQPHSCSVCCKTFSTMAVLTSHMNKSHNVITS